MLSLTRLRLLVELERHGTLAAVARSVSLTPSAVSQQLTQLEREIGEPLLERIGRGVRLTSAAQLLVAHARTAMEVLDTAEAKLKSEHGEVTGMLHVAAFQTVVITLLPTVLQELASKHPQLRVLVAQREIEDAALGLRSGEFDVVLGEEYPDSPAKVDAQLNREPLGPDPLRLAVSATGRWAADPKLIDLGEADWALDPPDLAPGRWARAQCRRSGFEPNVRFDGVDLLTHLQLVRKADFVAIVPALLGMEHLAGVRLAEIEGNPERELFTLTRTSLREHPGVLAFRSALADAHRQYLRGLTAI